MNDLPDPDPRDFTAEALECAIKACERSQHFSDRQFAQACREEIQRRLIGLRFRPHTERSVA